MHTHSVTNPGHLDSHIRRSCCHAPFHFFSRTHRRAHIFSTVLLFQIRIRHACVYTFSRRENGELFLQTFCSIHQPLDTHHHHPAFSHYCAESYIQRLPISAHPSRRRSVAPPRDQAKHLRSCEYVLFLRNTTPFAIEMLSIPTHFFSCNLLLGFCVHPFIFGVELCNVCFRESYVPNSEIPNVPPSVFKGYLLRVVENIQQLFTF